jgi:hypothetical protein
VYKPRLESTTPWDYPPANLWQDSKVDIVCVVRRSQTSNTEIWHNRALRFNFYLRGYKYLFIMKKPAEEPPARRKVSWTQYCRT